MSCLVDDQVKLPDGIEHLGIIMKKTFVNGSHEEDYDDTDVKLTPNSKLSPEEMTKFAKTKPRLKRLNAAK